MITSIEQKIRFYFNIAFYKIFLKLMGDVRYWPLKSVLCRLRVETTHDEGEKWNQTDYFAPHFRVVLREMIKQEIMSYLALDFIKISTHVFNSITFSRPEPNQSSTLRISIPRISNKSNKSWRTVSFPCHLGCVLLGVQRMEGLIGKSPWHWITRADESQEDDEKAPVFTTPSSSTNVL